MEENKALDSVKMLLLTTMLQPRSSAPQPSLPGRLGPTLPRSAPLRGSKLTQSVGSTPPSAWHLTPCCQSRLP